MPRLERRDRELAVGQRRRADEHRVGRLALEQLAPVGVDGGAAGERAGALLVEVAHRGELDAVAAARAARRARPRSSRRRSSRCARRAADTVWAMRLDGQGRRRHRRQLRHRPRDRAALRRRGRARRRRRPRARAARGRRDAPATLLGERGVPRRRRRLARRRRRPPRARPRVERFGRLDVMVANAGIAGAHSKPLLETTEEDWDAIMAVNLRGVFLCCRARDRRDGRAGADRRGARARDHHLLAARDGRAARPLRLRGRARAASSTWRASSPSTTAGRGVLVNAVAPGKILTGSPEQQDPGRARVLARAHAVPAARPSRGRRRRGALPRERGRRLRLGRQPARRRRLDGVLRRAAGRRARRAPARAPPCRAVVDEHDLVVVAQELRRRARRPARARRRRVASSRPAGGSWMIP